MQRIAGVGDRDVESAAAELGRESCHAAGIEGRRT